MDKPIKDLVKCNRKVCSHRWQARDGKKLPLQCPKCKRYDSPEWVKE